MVSRGVIDRRYQWSAMQGAVFTVYEHHGSGVAYLSTERRYILAAYFFGDKLKAVATGFDCDGMLAFEMLERPELLVPVSVDG